MRFDELYEKYLNGECTDEEKRFVEGELAKAMIVNEAVNGRKVELKPAEDEKIKKVKKKFNLKVILTACLVTVAVLLVATGAVLGGVFGTAVESAKKSDEFGMEKASAQAVDFVYAYLTDNGLYTGKKETMSVKDKEREFKMTTPLKNSVYVYEFEILAPDGNGVYEVEVDLNSATGKFEITDIDYEGKKSKPTVDIDWSPAEEKAIDCAYGYLTEQKGYTGTKESLAVVDREFQLKAYSGLGFYIYEFEIVAGQYEIDVVVNTHTESCYVKDIDIR